jgi:hypothetical protein
MICPFAPLASIDAIRLEKLRPDQCKAGPVDWGRLASEFSKQVKFGFLECCALVISIDEMLIKAFHQSDRVRVPGEFLN